MPEIVKYWLSIYPCGCLESYQKDDGSILPPGEVNDFVRQAVAKGNRTELQECSPGGYPDRACELHNNEKKKEVNMIGYETQGFMGTGANPENTLQPGIEFMGTEESRNTQSELQPKRRGRPTAEGVHEEIRKIKTVFYHPEPLFRPVADEVYLLKIPGIDIPWQEGLTAEEALDAWVKSEYDVRPMED